MTSTSHEHGGVVDDVVRAVKPKLRGWLHAGTFPLSLAAGIVLVALSDGTDETVANAVFAISAALLFGTSAMYHRGNWSPNVERQLKRFDHSNIFLIIAGTYTPFAVILLWHHGGEALLWIVWSAALGGIAFRILWVGAPRWLYTPIYLALGWVSVFYIGDIYRTGGAAVVTLLAVGGGALQRRRRGLRDQAPEPFAALVRLPRGVPRADAARVHRALHRRLAGDLPALTFAVGGPGNTPEPWRTTRSSRTASGRPCKAKVASPRSACSAAWRS